MSALLSRCAWRSCMPSSVASDFSSDVMAFQSSLMVPANWEVFCHGSPSGTSGMGMSGYFRYTGGTGLTFIDALHFLPQECIPWVDFSGTFCLPGPLHDFLEVVVTQVGS